MEFDTWRNLVVVSINDILSDVGKVSNSAKHLPLLTSLDFIVNALHQFPDMFVPRLSAFVKGAREPAAGAVDRRETKDVLHDSQPYSLTMWVTLHLLRILSVPGGGEIHGKTRAVLLQILRTASTHNPFVFRRLAVEFIGLLASLCKTYEKFFDESCSEKQFQIDKFLAPLESLHTDASELVLTRRSLVIATAESCQQLQTGVTIVLQDVHMELQLSTFDHVNFVDNSNDCGTLWSVVACQLEFGEIPLKTVSLRLASKLLMQSMPPAAALDYFINCLSALVNMLLSGQTDCEGDFSELEQALAETVGQLLELSHSDGLQCHAGLLSYYVDDVLTSNGIVLYLAKHGTRRLRTTSLRSALCRCVANVVVRHGYRENVHVGVVETLMKELGTCSESSCLTSVLVLHRVINFEVLGSAGPLPSHKPNSARHSDVVAKGSGHSSGPDTVMQQRSSGELSASVSEQSTVAVMLYERFQMMLDSFTANETGRLGGIRVIIEVLSHCAFSYHQAVGSKICELDSSIEFFDAAHLNQMLRVWTSYLSQISVVDLPDMSSISSAYRTIVSTAGSILSVHECGKTAAEILPRLLEILSLPWLVSEMSWLDFRPTSEVGLLTSISKVISDQVDAGVVAEVLRLLCIIPRHIAPRWRKHILCQCANDNKDALSTVAVSNLPILLHVLGSSSHHLVTDILSAILPYCSVAVKEAVAGVIGRIACVLSGSSTLLRSSASEACHSIVEAVQLGCTFCSLSLKSKKVSGIKSCESGNLLVPLVSALVAAEDKNVKTRLIGNFEQLFGHAWYWQNAGTVADLVNSILALQQDGNSEVRVVFYGNMKYLVPPPDAKTLPRMNALPIEKMAVECRARISDSELVLSSIGSISSVAENDLLLGCIIALLNEVLFPSSPLLEAVARQQMKQLGQTRRVSLPQLYMQYGKDISYSIVYCLHNTKSAKPGLDPAQILQKVADVFAFDDVRSYLKATEHLLVPYIVRKATLTASQLMKSISRLMDDPNHKNIIVRTIGHVFCYTVCSCDGPEESHRVFSYIESEMELPLTRLLLLGNHIDCLLLMQLSVYHVQVLNGLKSLLQAKGSFEGMDISCITNEQLASLLQPNLLGILVYFDKHLKDGSVPMTDKRQAYKSLIELMKLMGSQHITSVRMHIMTTLRIGLQFQDRQFTELCCEAWNCFAHLLDVSVRGSMLSQVVANLLPLLKREPAKVAEIFKFLVVDNKEVLKQHLHELYFLPDVPELQHIISILRPFVDAVYGGSDLPMQIEHLMKGASHELLDIRQMALSKLIQSLQANKDMLHSLILSSETAHPVISQLLTILLSGCREPDPTTRVLIGKCLGEIGAVDPGRLELTVNQPKEELPKFISSMVDDSFAFELVNELAKAFLGAEDRTAQDCAAYALQELMQIYSIRIEQNEPGNGIPGNGSSSRLWQRFSADVQEILTPLAQSRYMLNLSSSSSVIHPIYRSRKGANFESWVCAVTSYLGTKLTHDVSRRVFEACRGVVKQGGDSHIAVYILPHVAAQVILDGSDEARSMLLQEVLAVLDDIKEPDSRTGRLTDLRHMSAQTMFSLLDHLTRWLRHRQTVLSLQSPSTSSLSGSSKGMTRASNTSSADCGVSVVDSDKGYSAVKSFLDCIPQNTLAVASYNCGAYMRAFMHHEHHVRSSTASGLPRSAPESLDFLLKLYVAVDEPDGVAGIIAVQNVPLSLEQQILAFESVGRLSDASVCYEHAIRSQPENLVFRQGLLRNQLALGELNSALNLASGIISEHPSWSSELNAYRIESAWRLGQWDKLKQYVGSETTTITWNAGLGKLLLAAKVKDEAAFSTQLDALRLEEMAPLSAASMEAGSYQRGYEHIVRLHMLNELEESLRCLVNFDPSSSKECLIQGVAGSAPVDLGTLSRRWQARIQCCQLSYRYQDPILNLRRIVLQLASADRGLSVDAEVGQCWLQSARIARECGLLQTAQSSLLSAADYRLPDLYLEKAQWLWDRGDLDRAQSCLEKAAEEIFPDRASRFKAIPVASAAGDEAEQAARLTCARMLLQLGRYWDETASCESNAVVRQLKEVTQVHGEWEDGFFYVATYYDKVMMAVVDRPEKRGDFITQVVQFFGQSLQYGSQHIYQSMPRMLTLWLDYGAEVVAAETSSEKSSTSEPLRQGMRAALDKLNRQMAVIGEKLAPYQFLIALPQLVSRICHAHPEVFAQLRSIAAGLLCQFPHQCVWTMMAVSKSSYPVRVRRCQEIFDLGRKRNSEVARLLTTMTRLVDRLLELCNRQADVGGNAATTMSVSQHFKPLQRLIDDVNRSQIILPLQSQMTPTLPAMPVPPASHVPFAAASAVFLAGIDDAVDVLASLQRPKKLTLRGSDGRRYALLCKPKDDLRKDARLMEFNGIVNRCLRRDAESRRRALHIRTFSVTPLNEECGLLEWVPNTSGLRPILLKLYRKMGLYMSGKELKLLQLPPNAPIDKKLAIYRTKLLPRHPPVFGDWFLQTFTDPTSWYNARLAYCRTTAVMSMVGYVLGLGDRHGENILLDSTTGDCVHVDFNCLFNKGETFDYPEIVPFRLTHNMVEAMGPLGAEGIFRRSCEVTLRVMRDQTDALMSVLKTFIYDPLVEWSKPPKGRGSAAAESGEIRNEKAQTHVNNIEDRLRGILKSKTKPRGLPLSVEGHVSHLIKEATDENNLCQMYIGWAAYM